VIRIELKLGNLLLLLGLLVVLWISYLARDVIVLLGIALMLMATLHPLVKLGERRGLSHSWSVALVMLSLVLVPVAIIAALSPLVIAEVQSFAKSFPTLQQHINDLLRNMGVADKVNQAIDKAQVQNHIGDIAVVSAQRSVTILTQTFTVIVIAGYLLGDSRRLQFFLHEIMPRRAERHIEPLLTGMERVVGGYIRGQMLTSVLFGVFATLLCLALHVPDPLVMGIVAAIGDVIPLFGVPAAMLITMLVAFTHSAWQPLGVLAGYVIYGQLENHFLVPRIYARTVNLSPLMVIIATILGGTLDGIQGILIGIPIFGAIKVVFDYMVAERLRGREGAAETMETEPTDAVARDVQPELSPTAQEMAEAAETGEGVPPPSYSPFEPIPDSEPEAARPKRLSGARYITLARRFHRDPDSGDLVLAGKRRRR
jgi:predicted PurR-regulated permease PerM